MKKACAIFLILAMILAVVLVPAPVEAAEAGHIDHSTLTDHCACGGTAKGIGDHTTCTPVTGTWTDLNAYAADTNNYNNDNRLVLKAGNYYLTANLTTTNRTLVAENVEEVNICLNGYTFENKGSNNNARALYVANGMNTRFNVCDCQGGGKVVSMNAANGCVLISNCATVSLFSGTFEGEPGAACSSVRINQTATCKIYNATLRSYGAGNNLGVDEDGKGGAKATIYGGSIENTQPGEGAVYVKKASTFEMLGGSVIGGSINVGDAATGYSVKINGGFLQLIEDLNLTEAVTVGGAVIDLNGKKLTGPLTSVTGKIGLADSTVAAGENTTANVEIEGFALANVEQVVASPVGRYITLEKDGALSIHRIYVGFDKIRLTKDDDGKIGMNYVTNFKMDDEVKALLVNGSDGYAAGCKFGVETLDAAKTVGLAKDAYKANISTEIDAILGGNTAAATAAAYDICAQAFINLQIGNDVVTITSNTYDYSLQDVIDALYAVEDLETQNAAAAELLTFIKEEYSIGATA